MWVGWFVWVLPFHFSPVPHIVSVFQPNPSTAESSICKGGDLASCLLFDLFPNQYFNKIFLEGNSPMRYWLRKKYPCRIGPAWGNSEETWMSCLRRLTCCNARSVSCEPDLFLLLFQAVRLFPFCELYHMMGYSFHNSLFPDLPLMQSFWFGLVFCMLLQWWQNPFVLLQLCVNVLWLIQGRQCDVHFLLLQRRRK